MLEMFHHIHKDLGYLLFALLVLQFLLVVSGGAKRPVVLRILDMTQTLAVRICGPIVIVAGFVLWRKYLASLGWGVWWIWVSFLLWVPMEIAGKRLVRSQLQASEDELQSDKLLLGVTIQLIIVIAIFGMMTANAVLGDSLGS